MTCVGIVAIVFNTFFIRSEVLFEATFSLVNSLAGIKQSFTLSEGILRIHDIMANYGG